MKRNFGSKLTKAIPAVLASLLVSAGALAAPFSITYTGTISGSSFPQVSNGQPYVATLVFDNGGATAASQAWVAGDLRCVIWTMNAVRNVAYAQDLVASAGTMTITGSATTDAGGALTANFTSVFSNNATNYTVAGFVPVDPIQWFLNDANDVFYDNVDSFGDAAGGTLMAPANWSNPQSFTGACDAAAAVGNRPVPTLSQWGMIILSSLLALGSIVMLRRRRG